MRKSTFQIKIAGIVVAVTAKTERAQAFCEGFVVKEPLDKADVTVSVTDSELKTELKLYENAPSPDYCELVCIYRAIAEKLPMFDRFVFHGAAIEVDGKGYIFTAPPGTGKSTHIALWKQRFGDKVTVINGDKPILASSTEGFWVCSTPWAGKESWKTNINAPLGGICLLSRGKENKIERIDPAEYFEALIRQVYAPKDGKMMLKTLDMLDRLALSVPFYRLECNISEEAAQLAHDMMIQP